MQHERWETTEYAARVLGVTERQVRRLARGKKLESRMPDKRTLLISGVSLEELAEETKARRQRKGWRKLAHYKRTPYLVEPAFIEDCGPIRSRKKPDETDVERPGRIKGWSYWFYVPGYGREYAQSQGEEMIRFKTGVPYRIWGETKRGERGSMLVIAGWKEWVREGGEEGKDERSG